MEKQNKTMVTDLTGGSVTKLLLAFTLPLFVSNALQAVYNLVDMIVVGRCLGGPGISAVSIGGDILHLLTFLAMGFSSAGQVLIAQSIGARQHDRVGRIIGTMFTTLLSVSILISVICYTLRYPILGWLNTPKESYDYTMDYMVTCTVGLVFIYGYNTVSAILRGMGDGRRPFLFIAIAALLNIVLDVVFVAYCDMEVFGAALATVISQAVSFIISVVYLRLHRESFGFDFKLKSFKIEKEAFSKLLALGIPMAIQSAAVHLSKIVLTSWINLYGVVYSALGGLYNKIDIISNTASQAFTTAGSSMVGQNLGAKKYDRVPLILKTVAKCSLLIGLVFSGVMIFFSGSVYRMFTADQAVLAASGILIGPIVLNFFGGATRSIAFSLINGSGNTKLNLAVALIDGLISRIGIAALLGYVVGIGCKGFWYGDALAGYMPIVISMCYFFSNKWRCANAMKTKHSTISE